MNSRLPKISIVTPSLNQAAFLEQTILSVLQQDYPNLEFILIDGSSTDGSLDLINKYASKINFWVSEPDYGQSHAINKGMSHASGDLLNWLNADDLLQMGALHSLARAYSEHAHPDEKAIYCGSGNYVDPFGREIQAMPIEFVGENERILPGMPPYRGGVQASWFLTRQAWQAAGGISPDLDYTMDTDLYFRCQALGTAFYPVSHPLASCRVHADTKTLRGWESSVDYKKKFYFGKLNALLPQERAHYSPRIRSLLLGFCLKSITTNDPPSLRLKKVFKGLAMHPLALVQPYQLKKIFHACKGSSC